MVFTNPNIVTFTCTSSEGWCKVLPASTHSQAFLYNGININVEPSSNINADNAVVTIKTDYGKETKLKVVRAGLKPYMSIEQNDIQSEAKENIVYIPFSSNIGKENFKFSGSAMSWCKVEIIDINQYINQKASTVKWIGGKAASTSTQPEGIVVAYQLKLTINENPNTSTRNGIITVSTNDGKLSEDINISQKEGYITLGQNEYIVAHNEPYRSYYVDFTSSLKFKSIKTKSSADWCKIKSISEGYGRFDFGCEANTSFTQREATITLFCESGNVKATLKVKQDGVPFAPSANRICFDKNSSNRTISIKTSLSTWEAKSNQSWCTVNKNGNNLIVRATATTTNRKATISFKDIPATKTVEQSKYTTGDTYDENGIKGTVIYMQDTVRYVGKDLGQAVWSTENVEIGANDNYDGRKNMEVVKQQPNWKTLYPAFALCDALNVNGVTGWYLPAVNEEDYYAGNKGWSSTELNASQALFSRRPSWSPASKNTEGTVQAVHRF